MPKRKRSRSEQSRKKRSRSEPSRKKKHSHSEGSKKKKRSHSEPSKRRRHSEPSKKRSSGREDTRKQSSRRSRSKKQRDLEQADERPIRRMRRQARSATAENGSTSPTKTRKTTKPSVQEKHTHESRRTFPKPPDCGKVEPSKNPALVDTNRRKSRTPPPGECGFTQRDFSTYAPSLHQKHTRPSTPPAGWSEPSKSRFSTSSVSLKENQEDGQQTKDTTCDESKPVHPGQGIPRRRELHEFRRHWRDTSLGRRHKTKPYTAGVDFTVVSYNVLAQQLINMNDYLYHGCSGQVLDWEYRKKNLLLEFADLNADILCLQEIQGTHFSSFYEPELRKLGYVGVFKQRTGDKCDGCATFYKDSLFDMVEYKCLEYYRPGIQLLDRDNVAVILLLQPKPRHASFERICIANTHLLYNPRRGDIKLTQLSMLLAEIDRLSYMNGVPNQRTSDSSSYRHHPVIMCGDFNSVPQSALISFIQGGRLVYEGLRGNAVSGQEPWRNSRYLSSPLWPGNVGVTFGCQYQSVIQQRQAASKHNLPPRPSQAPDTAQSKASPELNQPSDETATRDDAWNHHGHLQHPFQFSSSYLYNEDSREVTTNHGKTNCTVDYIFHASGNVLDDIKQLRILSRLSLFTDEEASEMGGLPNTRWSSDHYSLAVKFLLMPQS